MKLCDYGCGREDTHPFKNGKWCCGDNVAKCPMKRKKTSERNRGKTHSDKTKRKMSEARKGCSGYWKGKKRKPHTEESKRKMSESNSDKNIFRRNKRENEIITYTYN